VGGAPPQQKPLYGHYRAIAGGSRPRPQIKGLFSEKTAHPLFLSGVKEVKGDSPEGIGAKRRPLTSEGQQPLVRFCQWVRFVSTEAVGEGVESLFPVRKRGFLVTGNNDLLSTKLGFLVLRKTGNNGGNNGMVQKVSRGHILRFQRSFTEKMTVSILSTLKITNSLFP
jgi:hypothetical protein